MLWDIFQQMQISDLGNSASEARSGMERARGDISQMQRSLDALCLTSAAMWELLSERLGVNEDELQAKIHEIELNALKRSIQDYEDTNDPQSTQRKGQ